MDLTTEFKQKVREAILDARVNYQGSDEAYAKTIGLNAAVYSRLKNGEIDNIISGSLWIDISIKLQVSDSKVTKKVVRTKVYIELEDNLKFCKQYSKAMIFADECDIGKTFCSKHILKGMKNAFYLDASQCKTKSQFIRALAKTIGVDHNGKYNDVKARLKVALVNMDKPLIVIDEAGDLDYTAFLEIKEIWNYTEGRCGWYLIGADGLTTKLENGFKNKKVGFAEIISRFGDHVIKLVPTGKDDRKAFFSQLINDVASANCPDNAQVPTMVRKCLDKDKKLRHLDMLIDLSA